MTERQKAYSEYLESDHWHRLRSKATQVMVGIFSCDKAAMDFNWPVLKLTPRG